MGWATPYIDLLKKGDTVDFRPQGNSMSPLIESGQKVTVEPFRFQVLHAGDIVLCKVHSREFLHKIVSLEGEKFVIGNNKGFVNGTVTKGQIFGICVKVEP